jgi:DNA repair exonuclease SbcCD nuclease subunit
MKALVTADIHLTDKPQDEYRWGLLPWLGEQAREHQVDLVAILGDLTDAKDRHSAFLVNRFAQELAALARQVERVVLLKGNHDYIDPEWPFFEFLNAYSFIHFVTRPAEICGQIFLPSTRDYERDWKKYRDGFPGSDYYFCHQTFDGALADNGTVLPGIPPSYFKRARVKVWSGDVHTQQKVGPNVEYVGAPYRIDFGDTFTPRVVLLDGQREPRDLRFPCPQKHLVTIRSLGDLQEQHQLLGVRRGDLVKVRVRLRRSEYPDWPSLRSSIRAYAAGEGWVLHGPELASVEFAKGEAPPPALSAIVPQDVVKRYASENKLEKDILDLGLSFLED